LCIAVIIEHKAELGKWLYLFGSSRTISAVLWLCSLQHLNFRHYFTILFYGCWTFCNVMHVVIFSGLLHACVHYWVTLL